MSGPLPQLLTIPVPTTPDHPKKTRERDDKGKKAKLSLGITRTEKLFVERHLLPPDAVFKGYEEVVVQEVVLRPEVILFQ